MSYGWGQEFGGCTGRKRLVRLTNAFSLNMLASENGVNVEVSPTSLERARYLCDGAVIDSCVGHADTAQVLSGLLGVQVDCNRVNISLTEGDVILVAQYSGPRLPEGAMTLPEGAEIKFYHVMIHGIYDPVGWSE